MNTRIIQVLYRNFPYIKLSIIIIIIIIIIIFVPPPLKDPPIWWAQPQI